MLIRVLAYCSLTGLDLDLELAQRVFDNTRNPPTEGKVIQL